MLWNTSSAQQRFLVVATAPDAPLCSTSAHQAAALPTAQMGSSVMC